MTTLFVISWRNFVRNFERYKILLVTLTVSVLFVVLFTGIILGMVEGIYTKAARFYTGHISIQGYERGQKSIVEDATLIRAALERLVPSTARIVERSIHYGSEAEIFFNGQSISQRRFLGVDWNSEAEILSDFDLIEGGVPSSDEDNPVLISLRTAELLGAGIGDSVLVSLETFRSHINTGRFTVAGIFREDSYFGFAAYMGRAALNEVMREPAGRIHEIGVFLKNSDRTNELSHAVQDSLETRLPLFDTIDNRADRDEALNSRWEGRRYIVVPLGVQLSTLNDLVSALIAVAVIVVAVFMAVIVIGISNTFSMLIFERIREVGTIRALGLEKVKVVAMFLFEAGLLGVSSTVLGSLTGVLLLAVGSRYLDLSWLPFSELFLVSTNLYWRLPILWIAVISVVVVASAVGGALRPSIRGVAVEPVEALRQ